MLPLVEIGHCSTVAASIWSPENPTSHRQDSSFEALRRIPSISQSHRPSQSFGIVPKSLSDIVLKKEHGSESTYRPPRAYTAVN
jgi:hypothetical protein